MTGPQGAVAATFFDGQTAQRHAVRIAPTSDGLGLAVLFDDAARGALVWPFDRIRALDGQADRASLTLTLRAETGDEAPRDAARLSVTDAAAVDWFHRTRRALFHRDV
ncbi:MAG: peptidase M48, partial [Rhodobacteraceae bacterium]|nr:peptidase M48 [Paracoccaceae bacterium]